MANRSSYAGKQAAGLRSAALAVAMMVLWMAACAPSQAVRQGVDLSPPDKSAPLKDATAATWDADPARLYEDIERAVEKYHWAVVHIESSRKKPDFGVIRAKVLTPDGRFVEIVGWKSGDNQVTVGIRVGHFGDADEEEGYLRKLAQVLAGKPKRKRGGDYQWPVPATPVSK